MINGIIRSILETYYDTQFSRHSHGFRPQRGCHTALSEIQKHWGGTKWYIEGDISKCFEKVNHQKLLSIMNRNLHDSRFLRLINNLLKAGYLENWKYNQTLSGVPQGSIVGPIFSNIYLNELDKFIESKLLPAYNQGKKRRHSRVYNNLLDAIRRRKAEGQLEEAKLLRKQTQQIPSSDPYDPNFRRLRYSRYADDWLLGLIGTREEAEIIKRQIAEFLLNELDLELSVEKTLITHARTEGARFLGYKITILHENTKHSSKTHRRNINGKVGLEVPVEVIKNKLKKYMRGGKPAPLYERIHDSDYSIVAQYQAEYRGFVQYYLMAYNVHRLWQLHYVMKSSLIRTLARKYKTSVMKIIRKYQSTIISACGTQKVLEVKYERGEDKKPLIARFGGISLSWNKKAILNDKLPRVSNTRSEILKRLLKQECELCGSSRDCEVHHIRKLADLKKKGRKDKPLWVIKMANRQRKTLVVCRKCHGDIHSGKLLSQAFTKQDHWRAS